MIDGLSFTAEISALATTTRLTQDARRVLAFKLTLIGTVGDVSLDRLKALQEAGELRVTLSPVEGAEHGGGDAGGRRGVLRDEPAG